MIKCEDGRLEVKGSIITISNDLTLIIHSIRKIFTKNMDQKKADDAIRETIRLGFMSEEEIKSEAMRILEEMICGMKEGKQDEHEN